LAGDVVVAGQGREDVQAQRHGWQCGRSFDAVCGVPAQGGGPDRPKLSDHHDPGGGTGRVLAAPCSATERYRKPCGRSRFDRDAAKAKTRQDGPDRRRDAAADVSGLQAWRAAGLRDGDCALARGGRSPEALPRAAGIDRRAHHACEPDQGAASATMDRCGATGGRGSRHCAPETGGSCRRI
jgi:hypothetical protein